jgi:hypothetical protein
MAFGGIRSDCMRIAYSKAIASLLLALSLAFVCVGAGCSNASSASNAGGQSESASGEVDSTGASSDAAKPEDIVNQLRSIEGVVSVESYGNDAINQTGLDQTYRIYEMVFEQPIDHDDASAGTFQQHVRLFYSSGDAVNIVNTDGYMLTELPRTAYAKFCNQEFSNRYGTPNIIQIEYRYFGDSTPDGLDVDSTALWDKLTVEQAAADFHEIVQKLSGVLSGKRLWTGTSKGGFTTDYQCYFQEQHGYNDADAFAGFCAPFCDSRSDDRLMNAVYGDVGYEAYGQQQASEWHELLDKFQLACIRHRDQLQAKYYQQALEEGDKFRESYFGTDEDVQAQRLWDLAVDEYPIYFWQYYQSSKVDEIAKAVNDDDPDEIYACVAEIEPPSSFAYNSGFLPYEIQSAFEMGNCTESFDHLRQLVSDARNAAPDSEKDVYYLATEGNASNADIYLSEAQLAAFPYSSSTRDAMIAWFNSTSTAHLMMVSGQSDPWYYVRPELTFSNSQIKCYESSYNHVTKIGDLSEQDQADFWNTLDDWLGDEN